MGIEKLRIKPYPSNNWSDMCRIIEEKANEAGIRPEDAIKVEFGYDWATIVYCEKWKECEFMK